MLDIVRREMWKKIQSQFVQGKRKFPQIFIPSVQYIGMNPITKTFIL